MAIKVCDWNEAVSGALDGSLSVSVHSDMSGFPSSLKRIDGRNGVLPSRGGSALTVGSFDGPHVGHKAIFKCVVQAAGERGLVPCVVTFRKPLGGVPVSTLDERLECFEKYGMKIAVVVDFSADFAKMHGSVFFATLREKFICRFIAEGEDFHCGYGGAFGRDDITAFCAAHDMECAFVPPVMMGGERVSSSRIRVAVAAGDIEMARMMLGECSFAPRYASLFDAPDMLSATLNHQNT